MKPIPGTLQEGGASFQTTHWTLILSAQKSEQKELSQQALSDFCNAYWPPLYAFLRRRGYSSPDAQDYVQGFFTYVLAEATSAGRIRKREAAYLPSHFVTIFVMDQHARARTLKRGGVIDSVL